MILGLRARERPRVEFDEIGDLKQRDVFIRVLKVVQRDAVSCALETLDGRYGVPIDANVLQDVHYAPVRGDNRFHHQKIPGVIDKDPLVRRNPSSPW